MFIVACKCRVFETWVFESVSKADRQFCRFLPCGDSRANILYCACSSDAVLEVFSKLMLKLEVFVCVEKIKCWLE